MGNIMKTNIWRRIRQMFGGRVYHRYPLVLETKTDGYIYGEITDHFDFDEEEGCTIGDGFVQTPNALKAGLIWDLSEKPYLNNTCIEPEDDKMGDYKSWVCEANKNNGRFHI